MDDHALRGGGRLTNKRDRRDLAQHVVVVNAPERKVAAGRAGLEVLAASPISNLHRSGECPHFVGMPAVEQSPARGICEYNILE